MLKPCSQLILYKRLNVAQLANKFGKEELERKNEKGMGG